MNYQTAYVVVVTSPAMLDRYMSTTKRGNAPGTVKFVTNWAKATWFTKAQATKTAKAMREQHPNIWFYARRYELVQN